MIAVYLFCLWAIGVVVITYGFAGWLADRPPLHERAPGAVTWVYIAGSMMLIMGWPISVTLVLLWSALTRKQQDGER